MHDLIPATPVVVAALRTHVWDDAVQLVYDKLIATRRTVVLIVDETRGPVDIPVSAPRLDTTNATFAAMGLPLLPSSELAMWFNGDYILYHLADQLSFDYLLLVEYDCVILGDIDRLVDRLVRDGTDYAVKNFGPRRPSYQWGEETLAWFGRTRQVETAYGGIYPVVFVSREAIADLREGRLEMADAIGDQPDKWVNCEPFCAMQLHLHGFRCRALRRYMGVRRCTVDIPILVDDAAALGARRLQLVHPVLSRANFDRKMALLLTKRKQHEDAAGRLTLRERRTALFPS